MEAMDKLTEEKMFTRDGVLISIVKASIHAANAEESEVKEYFEKFGKIAKICRLQKRTEKPPFEFEIQYEDPRSAARALQDKNLFKSPIINIEASDSLVQPDSQKLLAYTQKTDCSAYDNRAQIMILNNDCLAYICNMLNPVDQVNFALSCRRFTEILALHSKAQYKKNFDFHDIEEMTYFQRRIFLQIVGPQVKSATIYRRHSAFGREIEINKFLGTVLYNVEKLKVCYNFLNTLYNLIENMDSLKELELRHVTFDDKFLESIGRLKNLKKLIIIDNRNITGSGIDKLTGLDHLTLYNCPKIVHHLKDICKKLTNLTDLRIGCFPNRAGFEYSNYTRQLKDLNILYEKGSGTCLAHLRNLTNLTIKFDTFKECEEFFEHFIEEQPSQLQQLGICTSDFSSKLASLLTKLKGLKVLDCLFPITNNIITNICMLTELEKIEFRYREDLTANGILNLLEKCLKLNCICFWNLRDGDDNRIRSEIIQQSRELLRHQYYQDIRTCCVDFIFKSTTSENLLKDESSNFLRITDQFCRGADAFFNDVILDNDDDGSSDNNIWSDDDFESDDYYNFDWSESDDDYDDGYCFYHGYYDSDDEYDERFMYDHL